ncbi:hypothetical protein ABPG72_008206 [Tetrahymena utriculariae]
MLLHQYPLPTFYPPIQTYVDAKYNKVWRNQFLGSKQNATQIECIADVTNPVEVNCKTYDQYGQSCILCKPNYWLLMKSDSSGYFNSSNGKSKFKTFSCQCQKFTPKRDRGTSCQSGYFVNSKGDCGPKSQSDH